METLRKIARGVFCFLRDRSDGRIENTQGIVGSTSEAEERPLAGIPPSEAFFFIR